jgi:predicted nucleic acid-binding protein
MRALIDTNVLLDVLLARQPWAAESKAVWDAADAGRFEAYVCGQSFPNIFYIARKIIGLDKAHEAMNLLFQAFEIAPVDAPTIEAALMLSGTDFEDNLQLDTA